MQGILKTLVKVKNYGFIKGANGKEYFFHREDFTGFWDDLDKDFSKSAVVSVEFIEVPSNKGPRASNVKRLDYPN